MNSKKLRSFNEKLIQKIIIDEQWHKAFGVSQEVFERIIVFSERFLFSETENHPELKKNFTDSYVILITAIWLIIYIFYAYLANFLITNYIILIGKNFKIKEKKVNFFTISPGGKISAKYLEYSEKKNGLSIEVLGVNSWGVLFKATGNTRFETLLSLNIIFWMKIMLNLIGKIKYIYNNINFDSLNKEKHIAQFFYAVHKQIIMSRRSEIIAANLPNSQSLILISSESISFNLVESFKKNNHIVCHHLHGTILDNNLLSEPPLSSYIITAGVRESKIFRKYNVQVIPSVPPFQMHKEIMYSRLLKSTDIKFDVLLIASFELPFIQKNTYNILRSFFNKKNGLNMLLRHHPRVPLYSKNLINSFTKGMAISKNSSLAEDVASSKVSVCCSIDSLIIPLIMKKPTIFLPMTDGDYHDYVKDFDNYLPNLWCPKSKYDLMSNIEMALHCNLNFEKNYSDKISYLLGDLNLDYFEHTLNSLLN